MISVGSSSSPRGASHLTMYGRLSEIIFNWCSFKYSCDSVFKCLFPCPSQKSFSVYMLSRVSYLVLARAALRTKTKDLRVIDIPISFDDAARVSWSHLLGGTRHGLSHGRGKREKWIWVKMYLETS